MSYSAIAMARTAEGWSGSDVDLTDVEDLDSVAELLRDSGDGGTVLLFLEENDEYVAIVRVDGDDDARAYLSDSRVLDTGSVAGVIFDGALPAPAALDDDEEGTPPEFEPAGDPELLSDLGTSGEQLAALVAEEGMLPADVIFALCERAGCLDVLEEMRGV